MFALSTFVLTFYKLLLLTATYYSLLRLTPGLISAAFIDW